VADDISFGNKENDKTMEDEAHAISVQKDFFGRVIKTQVRPLQETDGNNRGKARDEPFGKAETKVWVTFHEGFSNAVRKPITLDELLQGL
jgi:chromosome transmission fidelity protein 18